MKSTNDTSKIIYEYPLSKRMKNFVKIEYLFREINELIANDNSLTSHNAIFTLHTLLNLLERNNVRSDIIKELEYQTNKISLLINSKSVQQDKLNSFLATLNLRIKIIRGLNYNIIENFHQDEFLNTIRQKITATGKVCSFENTGFHFWLNQSLEFKQRFFKRWLTKLSELEESIYLIMESTRNSSLFQKKIATQGIYHHALDNKTICQLIRFAIPNTEKYYPQISANRHLVNARFLTQDINNHNLPINQDIIFEISYCTL